MNRIGAVVRTEGRNGKIELLRFVFSLVIVLFHGKYVMTDKQPHIMHSGRIAVEFFFLVSGYLMAAASEKAILQNTDYSLAKKYEHFLLRKYASLYPAVFVSFFMHVSIASLLTRSTLAGFANRIFDYLPCLFLIQQTGICVSRITGLWYLSAMLLAMAILYPLMLRYHDYMKRIGSLLIGCMIIGFLMMRNNSLAVSGANDNELLFNRNLRAVAGLSLGSFSYEMVKVLNRISFSALGKKLLALSELGLYGIALGYMTFVKGCKYDYYIVFVLLAAVTLSFSKVPSYRQVFNNRFCFFLGKASYYIYLGHTWFARDLTPIIGPDADNTLRLLVYLTLATLSTAVLWLLCGLISRIADTLKKLLTQN